ncbi:hypothetical protein EYF80_052535 [Liparis tanakae]|uniref:Uncharacterized protein n=1 Tax=Liparis tanakae TaxID=230148 RepID=A0A4Z2F8G5_9TELE|nr:hypothetical protein EYF80_052535 [Liparis tanakae]
MLYLIEMSLSWSERICITTKQRGNSQSINPTVDRSCVSYRVFAKLKRPAAELLWIYEDEFVNPVTDDMSLEYSNFYRSVPEDIAIALVCLSAHANSSHPGQLRGEGALYV